MDATGAMRRGPHHQELAQVPSLLALELLSLLCQWVVH
jgi:hypothetical protein